MKTLKAFGVVLVLLPTLALAQQKSKKHSDVPAAFEHAQYIFVEAEGGDAFKPGLFPEDRQAIYDVQDGLQDWNRYTLAMHRSEADIVLVVRKGRSVGAQTRAGIGTRPPGGVSIGRGSNQNGQAGQAGQIGGQDNDTDPRNVGAEAEVGPANDLLSVYLLSGDGKRTGPVWQREMQDGLDAPSVPLFKQLRTAVERAYPSQPPAPKKSTP
jgi:hypothetical protein